MAPFEALITNSSIRQGHSNTKWYEFPNSTNIQRRITLLKYFTYYISIFRSKWKNAVLTFFKGNDYNFTSNKHKYWRRPTAPLLKKGGGLWYYERWKSRGHLRHIQPHHVQCVPLGHVGLVCSSDKGSDIWKTVEGQFNWSTRIDFRFCSCDTRYAIVLTKPWLTPLDSLYV